ncbi:MAG: ribonuclease HI [Gemmatimonadetes bacterium]|nr:ribonuclease HI [Gemmatimonadota bacterium]
MDPLVFLYADESCLGIQFPDRPRPGGAAGLIEHWRRGRWERRDYWVSEPATTNNRMALRSAIEGLRALHAPCRVVFTSDSQYLVRGMREWVQGWIRRGWKRKGGLLENEQLWRELVAQAARHRVEWQWVRGHAGHPQNEYANHLAQRAARTQDESGGAKPSGLSAWLEEQRGRGRYLDFDDTAPPG